MANSKNGNYGGDSRDVLFIYILFVKMAGSDKIS